MLSIWRLKIVWSIKASFEQHFFFDWLENRGNKCSLCQLRDYYKNAIRMTASLKMSSTRGRFCGASVLKLKCRSLRWAVAGGLVWEKLVTSGISWPTCAVAGAARGHVNYLISPSICTAEQMWRYPPGKDLELLCTLHTGRFPNHFSPRCQNGRKVIHA